jgi:hypothetical protein
MRVAVAVAAAGATALLWWVNIRLQLWRETFPRSVRFYLVGLLWIVCLAALTTTFLLAMAAVFDDNLLRDKGGGTGAGD